MYDLTSAFSHLAAPETTNGQTIRPHDRLADDDFLASVQERARAVHAGREILFEGDAIDHVTWVLNGWVALSKILDDGRRQIIDIMLPLDLTMTVSADGATSFFGMTAVTNSVVASCSAVEMARQRARCAELDRIVLRLIAAATARRSARMLRIGQGTARERVAYALLEFFVRLEAIGQTDGGRFRLPASQAVIGDLLGLTSVHVCRTLRSFARDGLIRYFGTEAQLIDIEALSRICKIDIAQLRKEIIPFDRIEAGLAW